MMLERRRRAIIAMADPPCMGQMTGMLLRGGIDVVGQAHTGAHALTLLARSLSDILIADMVLPALDGLALVRQIREMGLHTMPVAVITCAAPMPLFEDSVLREGAYAVLHRPFPEKKLMEILDSLQLQHRLQRAGADEENILRILRTLGFPLRMKGTAMLVEAIVMASRDMRLIDELTTSLYPLVARRFRTDQGKVEHAMRRAVESAWSVGALEAQHRIFGNTIDERRGKPTSGEFIGRVAELLRKGDMSG